ncbi:MAG TPA: tetratricopeptide repeat protein, partial [Burkholderiales bacterium]|nr:tetratricopeptide repeat protein [Burkholderiales bacterium]
ARVLLRQGSLELAAAQLAAAGERQADPQAACELAFAYEQRAEPAQALAWCARALQTDPRHAASLLLKGRLEAASGSLEASLELLQRALQAGADPAAVAFEAAVAYLRERQYGAAVDELETALHFRPDWPQAQWQLGIARLKLGAFGEAVEPLERAAQALGRAEAWSDLGLAYRGSGELEKAAGALRRAVSLDPACETARNNLGVVLRDEGRIEEARQHFERQLARRPDDEEAAWNLTMIQLLGGDFSAAWHGYERRWSREDMPARDFRFPAWQGEPLAEKTLFVYAEQGIGDQMMFASCLPEVIPAAKACVVECAPKLKSLFERSFPAARVLSSPLATDGAWTQDVPSIDYQVAIGSLPLRLGRAAGSFPRHGGYLRADPARVERWQAHLATLPAGPKIGISWRGGKPTTQSALRSLDLARLRPILELPAMHFVNLQYDSTAAEVDAARADGLHLHHWQDALEDYDETAALVMALDLVVTVCTALVHLAGALGRPAWVLVPRTPEWRYLHSGESMPWYPSVRLYRQRPTEPWNPVIARVAEALARHPFPRHA